MNLHQLKLFRDLATELSFVRVAQLNFLTQPAVSLQIKNLEQELGIPLFERASRRVSLTNEGRLLLPEAEDILRRCQNLRTLSGEAQHLPSGEVRLASIHSIGMYEIGPLLKDFLLSHPRIHVRLQYLQASDIYDLVIRKKVDIGLVAFPQTHPLLDIIPFGEDAMVVVVPPGHSLWGKQSVPLARLRGEAFIAFDEGLPTRAAIDDLLRKSKVEVDIRVTNDNVYAIKSAVQAKLGLSIVPSSTVEEEVRHGLLHTLKIRDANLARPRGLILRKKRTLSKAAEIFLNRITSSSE